MNLKIYFKNPNILCKILFTMLLKEMREVLPQGMNGFKVKMRVCFQPV